MPLLRLHSLSVMVNTFKVHSHQAKFTAKANTFCNIDRLFLWYFSISGPLFSVWTDPYLCRSGRAAGAPRRRSSCCFRRSTCWVPRCRTRCSRSSSPPCWFDANNSSKARSRCLRSGTVDSGMYPHNSGKEHESQTGIELFKGSNLPKDSFTLNVYDYFGASGCK